MLTTTAALTPTAAPDPTTTEPTALGATAVSPASRTARSPRFGDGPAPLLGVLGGMGPLATIHFYRELVTLTPAACDQDHVRTLIWSDPTIPDRTSALLDGGRSPVPQLRAGLRLLEQAGAEAVAIPCNTAHAFLPELLTGGTVPVIDMVRATVSTCAELMPRGAVIGVLATRGTRRARLYEKAADEVGARVLYPREADQSRLVDTAIALVKSGADLPAAGRLVAEAAERLTAAGAGVVVGACTEIPVAALSAAQPVPIVDSVRCLARECLRAFGVRPIAAAA